MNIFALEGFGNEIDWIKSAQSQDNYRVVKMILESCQMLCTALNELYGEPIAPYRSTHKNHPSSKWVRESAGNFISLTIHTGALIEEYKNRFNGKNHKCELVLKKCIELFDAAIFPSQKSTPLPLCMPENFKCKSIIESYRKFYASKPKMRYPENKIPPWFKEYRKEPYDIIEVLK